LLRSLSLCALFATPVAAQLTPQLLVPGYTLVRVSDAIDSARITQLAFNPNNDAYLYALQREGRIQRYDYDPLTGMLSNGLIVAEDLAPQTNGIAFHDDDLYVSMDWGGSVTVRPGDGRISRLSDPDASGVFQTRHDFVHSIPKGNHDVNQLQIVGDTLYVGIGAVGRRGDPDQENIYTMTVARIVDLTRVDFSGPIGADFKGPVNHLADETEWLDTAAADGLLRYYASGFRNPFGLAIDRDGDVWLSSNGNSDAGFMSPDYLYKKVPPGGQGLFPPASFGFGQPHIVGTPIQPLTDLGQNPAPTGLDFVAEGPEQGKVILAQSGASDQVQYPVGKDVLVVDPNSGAFQILIDDLDVPSDVVQDPFGRLLVADFGDGSIWLLTPPQASAPAGRVPDGATVPGAPLGLGKLPGGDLQLDWNASCAAGDTDYAIYEGTLRDFYDHAPVLCSTDGATSAQVSPQPDNRYFIVVPANGQFEGSHGLDGDEVERPYGSPFCWPRAIADCR